MSSCRKVREQVLRELDRELSLDAALALEEHLAQCAACAKFARSAQAIEEQLLALAEPPATSVDLERNLAEISRRLRADATRRPRNRAPRIAFAVAGIAAAVLALLAGLRWWLARSPEPTQPSAPLVESAPRESAPAHAEPSIVPQPPDESEVASALDAEAPGEPSTPTDVAGKVAEHDSRVDPLRREAALEVMRDLLRESSPLLEARASRTGALAFAQRVDELAREHELVLWPLPRLAESLFDERDVGAAAMCYAGLRGDRLAQLELERRATTELPALLARLDALDSRSSAVAAACVDARVQREVLARLREFAPADAARVLTAALSRPDVLEEQREPALHMLFDLGSEALSAWIELDRLGALERQALRRAVGELPGGSQRVAALASSAREDLDYWIDLCADLEVLESLAWLESLARERRTRESATAGLSAMARAPALDTLLRLSLRGLVGIDELERAFGVLALRAPSELRPLATAVLDRGDSAATSLLVDLSIAEVPQRSVTLLIEVAARAGVVPEERELAFDAIGEFGTETQVHELIAVFRTLGARERRLAASCAIAIERLGGRQALERLLAGAPRRHLERVLEVFDRSTSASVSRVQLARALEPVLDPKLTNTFGDNL